jgi:hypothetical protein
LPAVGEALFVAVGAVATEVAALFIRDAPEVLSRRLYRGYKR